eukprot:TRINITY_DN5782_c0_g1_i2.p1 TRINITY_DN5782_c0_g1~~TRINITY_DN5782_c0_g1_i2.p1  ORF type:complete len:561 (-),score=64.95 TRINITY_DN5782_c0_g1_i2:260-1942(-)
MLDLVLTAFTLATLFAYSSRYESDEKQEMIKAEAGTVGVELWILPQDSAESLDIRSGLFTERGCKILAASGLGIKGLNMMFGHVGVSYNTGIRFFGSRKQIFSFEPRKISPARIRDHLSGQNPLSGRVAENTKVFQRAAEMGWPLWRLKLPQELCEEESCGNKKLKALLLGRSSVPPPPCWELPNASNAQLNCVQWPRALGLTKLPKATSLPEYGEALRTDKTYENMFKCFVKRGTKFSDPGCEDDLCPCPDSLLTFDARRQPPVSNDQVVAYELSKTGIADAKESGFCPEVFEGPWQPPTVAERDGVELWLLPSNGIITTDEYTQLPNEIGCRLVAAAGIGGEGLNMIFGHLAVSHNVGTPLFGSLKQLFGFGPIGLTRNNSFAVFDGKASLPGHVTDDTRVFRRAVEMGSPVWKLTLPSTSCDEPSCGLATLQSQLQGRTALPSYYTGKPKFNKSDVPNSKLNCLQYPITLGITAHSKVPSVFFYGRETLGHYGENFQCFVKKGARARDPDCNEDLCPCPDELRKFDPFHEPPITKPQIEAFKLTGAGKAAAKASGFC